MNKLLLTTLCVTMITAQVTLSMFDPTREEIILLYHELNLLERNTYDILPEIKYSYPILLPHMRSGTNSAYIHYNRHNKKYVVHHVYTDKFQPDQLKQFIYEFNSLEDAQAAIFKLLTDKKLFIDMPNPQRHSSPSPTKNYTTKSSSSSRSQSQSRDTSLSPVSRFGARPSTRNSPDLQRYPGEKFDVLDYVTSP